MAQKLYLHIAYHVYLAIRTSPKGRGEARTVILDLRAANLSPLFGARVFDRWVEERNPTVKHPGIVGFHYVQPNLHLFSFPRVMEER